MALVWLAGMGLLTFASPLWREADWWLFAHQLRASAPPLQRDLALLDVPHDADVARYRQRLIDTIKLLAQPGQAPRAVVFDVQFVNDGRLVDELLAAMKTLRDQRTLLFAVVDPTQDGNPRPGFMDKHERAIYERAIDGQGHTVFETAAGVVKYDPLLALGDGQSVPALAVKAAETLFGRRVDADTRPVVVRLGQPDAVRAITLRFDPDSQAVTGPASGPSAMAGRIVVIGSLAADQPLGLAGRSGPEHLLWALSARGLTQDAAEARLVAAPGLLLGLVLASGGLAAGLVRAIYAAVPRSHSRLWALGVVAGAVPVLLLATVATALGAAGLLLPQVTLPTLAALLASGLAVWFTRRFLDWRHTMAEPPPVAAEYDVFISYSRTDPAQVAWVQQQIVGPLEAARRPDGEPFTVFLDREALHPGEAWLQRLYHAVDASRFFVPVYSIDYFKKDYCQRELNHALRRQRVDSVFIVGVDVAGTPIPSPYDTYQSLPARPDDVDVGARLVAALTRALHADEALRRAR